LLALLGLVAAGIHTPVQGQAPDEAWRTIRTEHFRVTFPENLEELGRRAADRSERAWVELSDAFVEPPDGVIDVLVTDHRDQSNGFAQVTPSNRITIFARPSPDALSLGHSDEWLELVITHELAHIFHLDMSKNLVGRVARGVFGRVSSEWPFFPELGTPRVITEGLATWYESRLTEAGRVRGTFHDMQIRTAVLEGRFENIGQAAGDSPLWPGGNRPYAYGSLFFDYLLEKHGEQRMVDFANAVAKQWIPYRLDAAGVDAFGRSLSNEWDAWEAELHEEYAELDRELSRPGLPVSDPERFTYDARWALYPTPSPDGRWVAYTRSDGRSDIQLRLRSQETGEVRSLGRTNGLATFAWVGSDRLLISQGEFQDPYRIYNDLYLLDLDGHQTRLTHGERLGQPSAAPDGTWAVAVRDGGGTNSIVRVDLSTGRTTTLLEPDSDVHWAFPRLSPDGRWIAVTRWEPEAFHDVVILDASNGRVVHRVTEDRALDMAPSWDPGGRWIVWTSDRSGIFNVLTAPVDPATGTVGEIRAVSNVRTGAAYPAVDPSGTAVWFSGYHVDGWELERLPYDPASAPPAGGVAARFTPGAPPPLRGVSEEPVQDYSAGATLLPTYWEVSYRDPVVTPERSGDDFFLRSREVLGAGIGIQTSGRDLVGRHAWSAIGRVFTTGGRAEGGVSYSYAGLGNPVVSFSANQRWSDEGQGLAGGTAQDTVFILERRRSIDAGVTFRAPSYRRDLRFTLSGGLIWERLELLGGDLEPTSQYQLARPTGRLADVGLSVTYNSSRTHSFQMGTTRGVSIFVQGLRTGETSLPDSLVGVTGQDRTVNEAFGQIRGSIPLWTTGRTTHVLALRATGGAATGPGAGVLHYRVGGASGQQERLTGLELFGGNFIFHPVRGYATSARFGRIAWTTTAEYRFPLWLLNQGVRAWPLHFGQTIGAVFFDAGNAWGPDVDHNGFANGMRTPLASAGVEVTTEITGLYDIELRVRGGFAVPFIEGNGSRWYVRVGLPF